MHFFNPLNAQLNPICHLLALLGAHHIFHVSGIRVNFLVNIFLMTALLTPKLVANSRIIIIIIKYYTDVEE